MQNNKIGSGLHNLGNTCFFNAVMQIILYTPPLAMYLQVKKHSQRCEYNKNNWCIFCSIEKLYQQSKQSRVVSPNIIVSNLRVIFKKFRLGRQEDSHQFLRYLIEGMQDVETGKLGKDREKNQIVIAKTLTYQIFGGKMRTFVLCLSCHHKSLTTQRYYDLSIECQRSNSLNQGLQSYFKVDQLTGSNKYRCDNCKQLSNAKKGFKIINVPLVVTFQFKRFTNMMRKINKLIQYPKSIDLSKYMQHAEGHEKIELFGVVVHAGSSASSGHYYAFIKNGNEWFEMNDSNVSRTNEDRVLRQQAYLLFYKRVNQHRLFQNVNSNSINRAEQIITNIKNLNHSINSDKQLQKQNKRKKSTDLLLNRKKSEQQIQQVRKKLNMNISQLIEQVKQQKKLKVNDKVKDLQKKQNNKIQVNNKNDKIQINGKIINSPVFGKFIKQQLILNGKKQTKKSNQFSKNKKIQQNGLKQHTQEESDDLQVPTKLQKRKSKSQIQSQMPMLERILRYANKISLMESKIPKSRSRRALRSVTKLRQFQIAIKKQKMG